ncbi:MAG TPA: CPBP family intramembrane glutamic endopeptidase [Vicinamibacterales bacterium]|nr:CPBP family intramembrane glutamic endopeptidase [Vicinamibacterales bacterium]
MFSLPILAVVLACVWGLEWFLPRRASPACAAAVLGLAAWRAARTGEWGFDRRAFAPALRLAALFTVPACAVLLAAGALRGTLHAREGTWADALYLVFWGGGQQFALQTVLLREAQQHVSRTGGVWIAAVVFGALHLPNPLLAPLTFVAGLAWCRIYDRHPHIVPLALSHAATTLAVLHAFDPALTGRLRVGYGYLLLLRE